MLKKVNIKNISIILLVLIIGFLSYQIHDLKDDFDWLESDLSTVTSNVDDLESSINTNEMRINDIEGRLW